MMCMVSGICVYVYMVYGISYICTYLIWYMVSVYVSLYLK